jgi:ABC-2 type transport system ATP-binding protein
LKLLYGKRALVAEIGRDGRLEKRQIDMDTPDTARTVAELFAKEKVVTLHSEEATLEDIFIQVTGRRLSE